MENKKNKEKKRLKITLLNKDYSIYTDEDEALVINAAKKVDNLFADLSSSLSAAGESQILLMLALQLATDFEKNKQELSIYQQRVQELLSLLN